MRLLLCVALLSSSPAFAQAEAWFRQGKPLNYREQDVDRRFNRTQIGQMLREGTQDPNCQQVVAALLTLLGEAAPYLHKQDEDFYLDLNLATSANQQLNSPRFPGMLYLAMMVRHVLIDGQMPKEWLQTAAQLRPGYPGIDLAKLKMLADNVRLIDSFRFTLDGLRHQHETEVVRVTSISNANEGDFRDRYLDREVAWNHFMLLDVTADKAHRGDGDDSGLVALLQWMPPKPMQNRLMLMAPDWKPPLVHVLAHLANAQYLDLYKLNKGHPVIVKGRFFEMGANGSELKIRDAVLFDDKAYPNGAQLTTPQAVYACPAAINDLQGTASTQVGGFGQRF